MKVTNTLFLALCVISLPTLADTKTDIAKCSDIESSTSRLECFDKLATKLGVDKPETKTTVDNGKWRVSEKMSKIDDSVNVFMFLNANEQIKTGLSSKYPRLILRCSEDKTSAFINVGAYLGMGETRVLTRLDKNKARKSTWSLSTDYKAMFVPGGDVKWIRKLMKHDTLLVEVTPYGESPVTMEFDLAGLPEAIKPLQKACHWK